MLIIALSSDLSISAEQNQHSMPAQWNTYLLGDFARYFKLKFLNSAERLQLIIILSSNLFIRADRNLRSTQPTRNHSSKVILHVKNSQFHQKKSTLRSAAAHSSFDCQKYLLLCQANSSFAQFPSLVFARVELYRPREPVLGYQSV